MLELDLDNQERLILKLNEGKEFLPLKEKIQREQTLADQREHLRRMRLNIFDAEDSMNDAIRENSIEKFEQFKTLFPRTYNALYERIN